MCHGVQAAPIPTADLEIVAHWYDGGPTELLDGEYLMKCQMCFAHTIIMCIDKNKNREGAIIKYIQFLNIKCR